MTVPNAMQATATSTIVALLSQEIMNRRLLPGSKLTEQKIADQFGVSRTLVRQALHQLSQQKLIVLEPARGAFVSTPSVQEAREVFAVRRMLEAEMMREFCSSITATQLRSLRQHHKREKMAMEQFNIPSRTELLGDFHVHIAELMGNEVLAQLLRELISRCDLITVMYQSDHAAAHSHEEHAAIIDALAARDADLAANLVHAHLLHVENNLDLPADERPRQPRASVKRAHTKKTPNT